MSAAEDVQVLEGGDCYEEVSKYDGTLLVRLNRFDILVTLLSW